MSGKRIRIDLFIPDADYAAIPTATKLAFRDRIRDLKAKAINIGGEVTVKATIHDCLHDEGKSCGNEVDI